MLGIFFVAVAAVAITGALFSPAVDPVWYANLRKPSFNPPNWLFAPVWTVLYAMIAVSAWLVWRRAGWARGRLPLIWWLTQLVLNALWTPLFFGAHLVGMALAIIISLLAAILGTITVFRPHHSLAAAMLLPYAAWVAFATVLNWSIWRLNS